MNKILISAVVCLFSCSPLAAQDTITIRAVGDLMIGTLFPNYRVPPKNGWAALESSVDYLTNGNPAIVMGNLEGTVTDYAVCAKKIKPGYTYAFRMPPESAELFKRAGFNVLTAANNHANDFGERGYFDTRKRLRTAGIVTSGLKGEYSVVTNNGLRIAIVPYAYFPRFNTIIDLKTAAAFISNIKATNDLVIVTFHGGAEGEKALHTKNLMETHLGEQRGNVVAFSRAAIDAGADLVIGHGPHLPRAMEFYKGRLIAYSLGNFSTYGMATQGHKKYTLILEAVLNKDGTFAGGRIIPFMQKENALTGIPFYDEQGRTVSLVRDLSAADFPRTGPVIRDDGVIQPPSADK